MLLGVGRFYHDPRGSVRVARRAASREATLIGWLMVAMLIILIGNLVALSGRVPTTHPDFTPEAGAALMALIFIAPLLWYAMAVVVTLGARLFGGRGGWQDGRIALFWATLVSAPLLAMSEVGSALAMDTSAEAGTVIGQVGPVFFGWALAQCITEVFGFSRTWAVFLVIGALVLALVALPLYM